MVAIDRLELVVVRHGLTAWNLERRYQGHRDIPLLWSEARTGLDRLRAVLAGEHFDAVYASDLQRCRQTLAHILPDLSVMPRFDARLRELDFGEYEGRCWEDLKDLPAYRRWIDSRGEEAPPGGESTAQLRRRLEQWWAEATASAAENGQRKLLVVTHGGVLRELRHRFEHTEYWQGSVMQAEGRRLMFEQRQGEWQCMSSSAVPVQASTPQ